MVNQKTKLTDIDINNIKFKNISKSDLIINLDRLTRFKYPEISYYRVIEDVICKYLINPKIHKSEIREIDKSIIKNIFEKIWNESCKKAVPDIKKDKKLNNVLYKELSRTYVIPQELKAFIKLDININAVLSLIESKEDIPINLKRLKEIELNTTNLEVQRNKKSLLFPVKKVLLCEGITEEILMPKFAQLKKYDFNKNGIKLLSAGGKNQVAKLYCELKEELKIPIFILLDADAQETAQIISKVIRKKDKIYLIKHGEFEDLFSLTLIKRTINNKFKNIFQCQIADIKKQQPMTKTLTELYRINELGDYKKAEFAKDILENIKSSKDLTEEILEIIEEIERQ